MKAKITASGLNLRKAPAMGDNVIIILKKGTVVDIQSESNGWAKVQHGIYSGYVSTKFIQILPSQDPKKFTLADRTLGIAISQLGAREQPQGSNWGPDIEKYLRSVDIDYPAAWCMAFVYWCTGRACKEMNIENPLEKTGSVMAQWRLVNRALKVKTPCKGDIFIMDFGGGKGHTGFVTDVVGNRIMTVEGNSNDEKSREGYEVCRAPGGRLISSCKGFIRLS